MTLICASVVVAIGVLTPIAVDIFAQIMYKDVSIENAKILLYLSSSPKDGFLDVARFLLAVALYEVLNLIPYILLGGYIIIGCKRVGELYLEIWNSLIQMAASLVPIFKVKRILISNSATLPWFAYMASIAVSLAAVMYTNIDFHYAALSDIYGDGPSSSTTALMFAVAPFYGMTTMLYVTTIINIAALYYVTLIGRA